MCGLPGQTLDDLARDIEFFAEMDVDMIGMGPYIPHPDTPLGADRHGAGDLLLGLKMIAVTRLHLHDVNIAQPRCRRSRQTAANAAYAPGRT